jgi:hypothetical protein
MGKSDIVLRLLMFYACACAARQISEPGQWDFDCGERSGKETPNRENL